MKQEEKSTKKFKSIRLDLETLKRLKKLQGEMKEEIDWERHVPLSEVVEYLLDEMENVKTNKLNIVRLEDSLYYSDLLTDVLKDK